MSRGMTRGERAKESPMGGVSITRRWAEYLVAILAGNILFLLIEPQLPSMLRHRMFRVDLGLGIDFLICVAVYGLVYAVRGQNKGDD